MIVRESKRNNAVYRQFAFGNIADLVQIFQTTYWFEDVKSITVPVIQEALEAQDEMDVDQKGYSALSSKTL